MDNKTFCNVFPAFKGGAELDALFSDTQVESIKTYETKKQMIVTLQSDHLIPYDYPYGSIADTACISYGWCRKENPDIYAISAFGTV